MDNKKWKQGLIKELSKAHQVFVIFGKKSIFAHIRTYLDRRHNTDIHKRLSINNNNGRVRTVKFLKENNIPYLKTKNINDNKTLQTVKRLCPDFGILAVDHLIGKKVIDSIPVILNAHYGNLPGIKGWNATEWSILVERNLNVCVHKVEKKVDNGPIYLREAVQIHSNDDFETLRFKSQEIAKKLYMKFFSDPDYYLHNPLPNQVHKNYYLMNNQLKEIAGRLIGSL